MNETVLVKFSADYADEFDVSGFAVMPKEAWRKQVDKASKIFEDEGPQEVYFGTNECVLFETYDDYVTAFDVVEISAAEHDAMKRVFNPGCDRFSFGHFLTVG